ncbi:COP9 signalosome [Morchella snyderi]|nr:COP9 signalosome [Morchella snyderi]
MDAQLNLGHLSALITDQNLSPAALVDLLADLEATASSCPLNSSTSELISNYYSAYFFSLFLCDDLNEARFLSKRIPLGFLQSDPLLISTYTLLRALYTRSYQSIYTTLSSAPWSGVLTPLVSRFEKYFRRRTFILLSRAYTAISLKSTAIFLGLEGTDENESSIIAMVVAEGWGRDEATGMLKPVPIDDDDDLRADVNAKDGGIARLTGLVTHLTEV